MWILTTTLTGPLMLATAVFLSAAELFPALIQQNQIFFEVWTGAYAGSLRGGFGSRKTLELINIH